MIKASELRIGNAVEYLKSICWVTEIYIKHKINDFEIKKEDSAQEKINKLNQYIYGAIDVDSDDDIITPLSCYKDVNPIPLTKDWLLGFGFEKEGEVVGRLQLDTDFGISLIDFNNLPEHCKYVHQFQNLHFVLTGEEIEIK